MLIFKREIENQITKNIEKRGITLIFGPRQAGKTTLVKTLLTARGEEENYFNCELADVRRYLCV